VSDPIDGTLPSGAIVWREDGSQIGTGSSITHMEGAVGTHTVTVTATNGDGKSASATVTVRVKPPPGPISVSITSPADKTNLGYSPFNNTFNEYCQDVQFQATASGGSGPLTYTWTDSRDGGAEKQVSTSLSPLLTLCAGTHENQSSTHDLTLTVTDGKTTSQAFVEVYVLTWKLA
jgi:hypothetical protein